MVRSAVCALGLVLGAALSPAPRAADLPAPARRALAIATDGGAAHYAAGRAALLDLRLDDADVHFRALGREEAGPAAAFGLHTSALWRALLSEEAAAADRFASAADSLDDVLRRAPASSSTDLLRATATLQRALVLLRAERYPRGGLTLRDACAQFRALAARDDALADVGFGLGTCEAVAGSVPRSYRWLARLLGFSGTVPGGMAWLARAADGQGAMAVEAAVTLAIVDASLNEQRGGALAQLVETAAQHPSSPVLAYFEGYHLLLARRAVDAEAALRRAEAALGAPGTVSLPYVQAHLGLALYRQERFQDAIPLLEAYLRAYRGRALVAQTALVAGLAHEMTGDRRRAVAHYRRIRAGRDFDSDLAARRAAERLLDAPLSDTERTLLLGETAYDAGRYDEAIRRLQTVVTDAALAEVHRAEAAYRTGRAYQALGQPGEARRHFRLAADRPGDPLAKWGPWALYHIAETHEADGDLDAARRAYREALDNEAAFDYHKSLEQRARAALDRLR
jgi:tetratricopeptide (TPR) repeat protein